MIYFCFVGANGRVFQKGMCPDEDIELQVPPVGFTRYNAQCDLDDYLEDGVFKRPPERPTPNYVFDYTIKDWVLDENLAITAALQQRSRLLIASDWTQLPDVPLATKEAWAVYRQALRDITLQAGYPLAIDWPLAP
jgi:hypothetical protein